MMNHHIFTKSCSINHDQYVWEEQMHQAKMKNKSTLLIFKTNILKSISKLILKATICILNALIGLNEIKTMVTIFLSLFQRNMSILIFFAF